MPPRDLPRALLDTVREQQSISPQTLNLENGLERPWLGDGDEARPLILLDESDLQAACDELTARDHRRAGGNLPLGKFEKALESSSRLPVHDPRTRTALTGDAVAEDGRRQRLDRSAPIAERQVRRPRVHGRRRAASGR